MNNAMPMIYKLPENPIISERAYKDASKSVDPTLKRNATLPTTAEAIAKMMVNVKVMHAIFLHRLSLSSIGSTESQTKYFRFNESGSISFDF